MLSHRGVPGAARQQARGHAASTAPRSLRAASRLQLRPQCSTQQPGSERSSSGDCGPSPNSSGFAHDQQQHKQQQQSAGGAMAWLRSRRTGALGAAMAGSWAVAFPGLGFGGSGGGGSGGGGGGGGGWWGNGGAGNGDGSYGGNSLFDLAAAASAGSKDEPGKGKKEKSKKKKQQQEEEEDPEAAAAEALLEEAEAETEEAPEIAVSKKNPAEELITSESELDEMLRDAGVEGDGKRHGTRRCVEVVIEGWPEVGALPKQVGGVGELILVGGVRVLEDPCVPWLVGLRLKTTFGGWNVCSESARLHQSGCLVGWKACRVWGHLQMHALLGGPPEGRASGEPALGQRRILGLECSAGAGGKCRRSRPAAPGERVCVSQGGVRVQGGVQGGAV